ncbi:MAG: carbohydrate-binding protein [Bacteroidales bacterium]|nr:carbohydrate-binding protein [Bacteroidales bacterium]
MLRKILTLGMLLAAASFSMISAQGYLHTDGKLIVDGNGEPFIIRSIGTGNWMIQEGYMMQTAGVAGTQHEFRKKLEQTIGEARTAEFYDAWLENHFTKQDVDSMAAWGFNAVRPALHYKWFTLPIEEEPVAGEQTWLENGFNLTDSLVKWCSENEMYVIFDMHGAPGGQGANADISDYDPAKPSLWESEANKTKLVALWRKIAERYHDEPWVGGYDLINETNWTFPEGNNSQMKALYERITDTIRQVDQNHIIYIEGNWFANDFSGLLPPWDDNLVYSFHKYWTFNGPGSLDYATWIRDQYNVPLWMGESGENSNTWFTNLISLLEQEQIGWSWWPVKKPGLNNILRVKVNPGYARLIDSWRGNATKPSADEAFAAVMQFAENHRFENCVIQWDVIDAMIRQPHTTELRAYREFSVTDHIFATDYALGRNGCAYFDNDTANYHGSTDEYTQWNIGGQYRNDGVDIQRCSDSDTNNGYNVGWIEDGEWLVYLIRNNSEQLADVEIRASSGASGGYMQLEANGHVISGEIYLPPTGGWDSWRTTNVEDLLLPAGDIRLKVSFPQGGVNFSYLRFTNFRNPSAAPFETIYSATSEIYNTVSLHLNREATASEASVDDFALYIDNSAVSVTGIVFSPGGRVITLETAALIAPGDEVTVSWSGDGIRHDAVPLTVFNKMKVVNNAASYAEVPGKIEAEDFYANAGMELETCLDEGGGQNTGYASPGDYLEYVIHVPRSGLYQLDNRVALQNGNATVNIAHDHGGDFESGKTVTLMQTGGWQDWQTQPTSIRLPRGKYRFRIKSASGEFNLNWMEFSLVSNAEQVTVRPGPGIYPNPADAFVQIDLQNDKNVQETVRLFDNGGRELWSTVTRMGSCRIDTSGYPAGVYFLVVSDRSRQTSHQLLIN